MNKFLITGFSGFVSRHFLKYLESNKIKATIVGLDIRNPESINESFKYIKYDFKKLDLLQKDYVDDIIGEFKPDYILHLASLSSVALSWNEPSQCFINNTNIFLNLLEAVRNHRLSTRILSVGSSEEYGDVKHSDLPVSETHPLSPSNPYAVARVSQEFLAHIYVNGYDLDIIMTRSFNHMGPFQKDIFVVPSFAKQLIIISKHPNKKGELFTGDTNIVKDFSDVRDVVSAYYLLFNKGKKGEIYNVCSGVGISLKKIISIMCEYLDIEVIVKIDPNRIRKSDSKMIIGSNKKLINLGWKQKYQLEDTLSDIINYWKIVEYSHEMHANF
jgi:GDP-4-dehydro-6-deoxy-D-mannose reductase